jgi:hypothetical protein
MKETQGRS